MQVVPDAESGLLRATLARERNPSGPLLKRDGEGRFWVALNNGGVTFPASITAQTAEFFRRMDAPLRSFPTPRLYACWQ